MIGNKELARIHAMKKEAELTDEDYRLLLSGAAGIDSAKDIASPDQYYKIITALSNLLMAKSKIPFGRSINKRQTFCDAVKVKASTVLGKDYQVRLSGYLRKMGKADLAKCNDWELRQVMGFLSRIEKQEKVTRRQKV
ncbi:MAG: regulatory protein GemA [Treponema sp.]|nr:regulatory protein GemA [Treponema sp.]